MKHISHSLVFLLLILTACVPFGNIPHVSPMPSETAIAENDDGLFGEGACRPPCWKGLVPGKSTKEEVDDFLKNLSPADWPRPRRETREYNKTSCSWTRMDDSYQTKLIDLYLQDGKLTFVRTFGLSIVNLGQIVDHFGPPEYIRAVLAVGPDGTLYILEVYYPKRGLAFEVSTDVKEDGIISPDMLVEMVHYFSPGDLLSYFTTRYSCDFGRESATDIAHKQIENFIQGWPGFGKVKLIESR